MTRQPVALRRIHTRPNRFNRQELWCVDGERGNGFVLCARSPAQALKSWSCSYKHKDGTRNTAYSFLPLKHSATEFLPRAALRLPSYSSSEANISGPHCFEHVRGKDCGMHILPIQLGENWHEVHSRKTGRPGPVGCRVEGFSIAPRESGGNHRDSALFPCEMWSSQNSVAGVELGLPFFAWKYQCTGPKHDGKNLPFHSLTMVLNVAGGPSCGSEARRPSSNSVREVSVQNGKSAVKLHQTARSEYQAMLLNGCTSLVLSNGEGQQICAYEYDQSLARPEEGVVP